MGWQRSQGAATVTLAEFARKQVPKQARSLPPTPRARTSARRYAWLAGALFTCAASPRLAQAQVSAWQADPGCPAPTNLPLASLGRRADAPADDLSVRVTVTAVEGGWRAVLAASEHGGSPLGERVLEHPTCEELNRAVLVSLSVLLGTQSPLVPETEPAPEANAGSIPAASTAPSDAASEPAASAAPTAAPTAPEPANSATPVLAPAEVTERVSAQQRRASADADVDDEPPAEVVSPRWSLPRPTFDVYGGFVFGLEAMEARTFGGEASVLASNRSWGVRLNGGRRYSAGNVADDPDVKFWVTSGSLDACKYFESATWLVCVGPLVEWLHGSVPAASKREDEAWLLGGRIGVSTLRHTRDTWGWFAQLELQVRRGANFQVQTGSSPPVSQTLFSYPWAGLLLSLGPAVRL